MNLTDLHFLSSSLIFIGHMPIDTVSMLPKLDT